LPHEVLWRLYGLHEHFANLPLNKALVMSAYSQFRALAYCIFRLTLLYYYILYQLEGMGFNRELVLEVFFACNKDEELAANYLLDHGHEFDEQQQ
jgi:hypothetical protein